MRKLNQKQVLLEKKQLRKQRLPSSTKLLESNLNLKWPRRRLRSRKWFYQKLKSRSRSAMKLLKNLKNSPPLLRLRAQHQLEANLIFHRSARWSAVSGSFSLSQATRPTFTGGSSPSASGLS